jgi:hypothetical protein
MGGIVTNKKAQSISLFDAKSLSRRIRRPRKSHA